MKLTLWCKNKKPNCTLQLVDFSCKLLWDLIHVSSQSDCVTFKFLLTNGLGQGVTSFKLNQGSSRDVIFYCSGQELRKHLENLVKPIPQVGDSSQLERGVFWTRNTSALGNLCSAKASKSDSKRIWHLTEAVLNPWKVDTVWWLRFHGTSSSFLHYRRSQLRLFPRQKLNSVKVSALHSCHFIIHTLFHVAMCCNNI